MHTNVCVRLDCRTPPPLQLYHGFRPPVSSFEGSGRSPGAGLLAQHNSHYDELGRKALVAQHIWWILLNIGPARTWLRDSPQAAMRASRCRRCGGALACKSPGRRVSQSLVPSSTPSRGRARTHSSAPAGSAQSLPAACAVDTASACLTAGSRLLASCACRSTKASKGAGARTPPRTPGCLCARHQSCISR